MYREVYKRICCALPEHSLEPVEHICLQNACCSTPLICALCKLERHTVSDKTVSLHEFLAALAKNCLQAKSTVRKCAFLDSIMLRLNAKVKLLR